MVSRAQECSRLLLCSLPFSSCWKTLAWNAEEREDGCTSRIPSTRKRWTSASRRSVRPSADRLASSGDRNDGFPVVSVVTAAARPTRSPHATKSRRRRAGAAMTRCSWAGEPQESPR